MIARIWRGWTSIHDADAYVDYLTATGMKDSRATPGNRGVLVLRRAAGDRAEFTTVTFWETLGAIDAFAGRDRERAVFYPGDERFLVEREWTVAHDEVVHADVALPVSATDESSGSKRSETSSSPAARLDVLGIDNVMVAVGDLPAARRFYSEILSLEEKFAFAEAGIVGFRLGDEEPGLVVREVQSLEAAEPRETPRLWVEVSDARTAATALQASGVELLSPPHEVHTGWVVEIADPWGNVVGLTDYTKAPERARGKPPRA